MQELLKSAVKLHQKVGKDVSDVLNARPIGVAGMEVNQGAQPMEWLPQLPMARRVLEHFVGRGV